MLGSDRDAASTDALLTDLYLDALLAGAVLDSAAAGSPDLDGRHLDPAARRAADRLRRDLVRVHPSFRFEERLATRLAEAAVALRMPIAAGDGRVVAFRTPIAADTLDPGLDEPDPTATRRQPARPLIIGGALTSAALSIAGAALVAWRLGRPSRQSSPMARAARAVREARLAEAVGGGRRSRYRRPD